MTILIGVKFENSVLFLADTLTNSLNEAGEVKGVLWSDSQKVRKVRKEVAIATAGLGTLGHSVTAMIEATLSNDEIIASENVSVFTQETMNYALQKFIHFNPNTPYAKLAAVLGGIEDVSRKPFLYELHSDNNFDILAEDIVVLGVQPEADIIRQQIVQMSKDHPGYEPMIYAHNFANILRLVTRASVHVGSEVFITEIRNDGITSYQYLGANGEDIPIPKSFNCV